MEFSRIRQQIREFRDEQNRLLPILMRFMGKTGFFKHCDNRLPVSQSNSAYSPSTYMKTLFALCVLYPDSKDPSEESGQCELEGLENTDYRYFSIATNEQMA